jgi:hypothetical protein
MCGSNVIISYFTLFFSRIKCFQTVYVKNDIITIFYMTIERNGIYKTAKLSLFCKVIDFRTNDYDLSTVAYKFIIKTQPFFFAEMNDVVYRVLKYPLPLPHLHLILIVFLPTTMICTSHISIAVVLSRT